MKTSFRWFGLQDRVPLGWIRQMTPRPLVVTHLSDALPGEVWSKNKLNYLASELNAHQLEIGPIESMFWSDAMKLGLTERDQHIENYRKSLFNLREVFRHTEELIVTYNVMPLDWGRTSLSHLLPNGTHCLAYDQSLVDSIDLTEGLFLPGWGKRYSHSEFNRIQSAYKNIGDDGFWKNIEYVLQALVPIAELLGIRLAVHPNDPPWSYLGLPALLCDEKSLQKIVELVPSRSNALCLCTGSLGANPENDIISIIDSLHESIAWMHIRNVKITNKKTFHEVDHADPEGRYDLLQVVKKLKEVNWNGPFRSDHGLDLFYETNKHTNGYPAIDRYVSNKMLWAYWQASV